MVVVVFRQCFTVLFLKAISAGPSLLHGNPVSNTVCKAERDPKKWIESWKAASLMGWKTNKQPWGERGHKNEWIPCRGHFMSARASPCVCRMCVCVSVNEPYRAEAGGPHHSFTRSFYSHSESPRKPSVCVWVCVKAYVLPWGCVYLIYKPVGCARVCVCEYMWPETAPAHFPVCTGAYDPKIEMEKMKYNNPNRGGSKSGGDNLH